MKALEIPSPSSRRMVNAMSPTNALNSARQRKANSKNVSTNQNHGKLVKHPSNLVEGYYYDWDSADLRTVVNPYQFPIKYGTLHQSLGVDTCRKNNLHVIADDMILFITGNTVSILNILSGHRSTIVVPSSISHTAVSIGAVAVHPSREFIAIAQSGESPHIYVYSYPQLQVVRVLTGGAEQSYTAVNFSSDGERLVSVAGSPDFTLGVWDWRKEFVLLRSKAFSQEVYSISFLKNNSERLVSSGSGHVRFWRIAETFTGLKLQGTIGKFGAIDLSDISSFVQLGDGRIATNCDQGNLLVWNGNLIAFQACRSNRLPLHEDGITCMELIDGMLVTCGNDGYIRTWAIQSLEYGEVNEDDPYIYIEPIVEVSIGENWPITNMAYRGNDSWYIMNTKGGIYQYTLNETIANRVFYAHGGPINSITSSTSAHVAVTAGSDHSVRAWDVYNGAPLATRSFSSSVTALKWLSTSSGTPSENFQLLAIGFADGVLRIVRRFAESFQVLQAIRPHSAAILGLAVSCDGLTLATAAADSTIYFYQISPKLYASPVPQSTYVEAIGFSQQEAPATHLQWHPSNSYLLCSIGPDIFEFEKPTFQQDGTSLRDSYEIAVKFRKIRPQLKLRTPAEEIEVQAMRLKRERKRVQKEKERAERVSDESEREHARRTALDKKWNKREEWVKAEDAKIYDIATLMYAPETFDTSSDSPSGNKKEPKFWFSLKSKPNSIPSTKFQSIYQMTFNSALPETSLFLGKIGMISSLSLSSQRTYMLIGTEAGIIQLRPFVDLKFYLSLAFHSPSKSTRNVNSGSAACISSIWTSCDEKILLSSGIDGAFFAFSIDMPGAVDSIDRSLADLMDTEYERLLKDRKTKEEAGWFPEKEGEKETSRRRTALPALDISDKNSNSPDDDEETRWEIEAEGSFDQLLLAFAEQFQSYISAIAPITSYTTIENCYFARLHDTNLDINNSAELEEAECLSEYSLEEARKNAESNEKNRSIQQKKEILMQEISMLRAEFVDLAVQNKHLQAQHGVSLAEEEILVDSKLANQIEKKTMEEIEKIKQSLRYELEKKSILLEKLKSYFLKSLITEFIRLNSFLAPVNVCTYRVSEIPEEMVNELHMLQEEDFAEAEILKQQLEAKKESLKDKKSSVLAIALATPPSEAENAHNNKSVTSDKSKGKKKSGGNGSTMLSESERRRRARAVRAVELTQLKLNPPDKSKPLPEDAKEYSSAELSIGDYKLKSDPSYKVPAHHRITPKEKKFEFLKLISQILSKKSQFNERIIALRGVKKRIIESVHEDVKQIKEMSSKLENSGFKRSNVEETFLQFLMELTVDRKEWPDMRDHYTSDDLKRFQDQKELEISNAKNAVENVHLVHSPTTTKRKLTQGLQGDFMGSIVDAKLDALETEGDVILSTPGAFDSNQSNSRSSNEIDSESSSKLSNLQKLEQQLLWARIGFEQSSLIGRISTTISSFDNAVRELRLEKLALNNEIKAHELRAITLYSEYKVISEFEEKEKDLNNRIKQSEGESSRIAQELQVCDTLLQTKSDEYQSLQDQEKQLFIEFTQLIGGEKNENYPQYLRIYRKKPKSTKTRPLLTSRSGADGPTSSRVEGEWNESEDEDSDDDLDDHDEQNIHLDLHLYEKIIELREKRIECEISLELCNRIIKEAEANHLRIKTNETDAANNKIALTEEVSAFQSEKQRALNMLEVSVPLKCSQLCYLTEDDQLPEEIPSALLFPISFVDRLDHRAQELVSEIEECREINVDLKRDQTSLQKEVGNKRGQIEAEKLRCAEVQRIKFGREIDLTLLESIGQENEEMEKLAEEVYKAEMKAKEEQKTHDDDFERLRMSLHSVMKENTQLLTQVGSLTQLKYQLEERLNQTSHMNNSSGNGSSILNATSKSSLRNSSSNLISPMKERSSRSEFQQDTAEIIQLVSAQEAEIEALKKEIFVLRRKDGHIYTQSV